MTLVIDCEPTPERLMDAAELRRRVFVIEQGVDPAIERDGNDPRAHHVVVSDQEGRVIGTGRLMVHAHYAKVQRVAVDAQRRGEGIGRAVMEGLDRHARRVGIRELRLSSQAEAVPFYLRLGYRSEGEPYLEAGIWHLAMTRTLSEGDAPSP